MVQNSKLLETEGKRNITLAVTSSLTYKELLVIQINQGIEYL